MSALLIFIIIFWILYYINKNWVTAVVINYQLVLFCSNISKPNLTDWDNHCRGMFTGCVPSSPLPSCWLEMVDDRTFLSVMKLITNIFHYYGTNVMLISIISNLDNVGSWPAKLRRKTEPIIDLNWKTPEWRKVIVKCYNTFTDKEKCWELQPCLGILSDSFTGLVNKASFWKSSKMCFKLFMGLILF